MTVIYDRQVLRTIASSNTSVCNTKVG